MAFRSFDSFGALREQIAPSRPGVSTGYEILRVAAEITADDGAVAARTCRAAVLDWARSHCGGELPPAAAEHGSFTFAKGLPAGGSGPGSSARTPTCGRSA